MTEQSPTIDYETPRPQSLVALADWRWALLPGLVPFMGYVISLAAIARWLERAFSPTMPESLPNGRLLAYYCCDVLNTLYLVLLALAAYVAIRMCRTTGGRLVAIAAHLVLAFLGAVANVFFMEGPFP